MKKYAIIKKTMKSSVFFSIFVKIGNISLNIHFLIPFQTPLDLLIKRLTTTFKEDLKIIKLYFFEENQF